MALEGLVSGGGHAGANVWDFSIDGSARNGENSEELVRKLEQALNNGSKVKITYRQPLLKWPWRGDTSYFILNVEPINDEQSKKELMKHPILIQ